MSFPTLGGAGPTHRVISKTNFQRVPKRVLLRFSRNRTTLPLTMTTGTRTLSRTISTRVLISNRTRYANTITVSRVSRDLTIRSNTISRKVRLQRYLVSHRTRRVTLRFNTTLRPLCPTIQAINIANRTKVPLLHLNLNLQFLSRLFKLLRTRRQGFNLSSSNTGRSVTIFVQRDRRHYRLVRLNGTSLLPRLSLLRQRGFLSQIIRSLNTSRRLFQFFFNSLPHALDLLLDTRPLVLLRLAGLVHRDMYFTFRLLHRYANLNTNYFRFIFTLLSRFIPLFTNNVRLVNDLVTGLFRLILTFLRLRFRIIRLTRGHVRALILYQGVLLYHFGSTL